MSKPVILLVDDELDLLQVTAEAVRRALPTYEVVAARSPEEAAEALLSADGPPALACVDHVLGGASGLGFLEALRERFPSIRLMLFTGKAPADVEDRARQSGVHVTWKPVRLKQLVGEMAGLLATPA